MQVDILHVPQCPNLSATRSRVREALYQSGVEGAPSVAELVAVLSR